MCERIFHLENIADQVFFYGEICFGVCGRASITCQISVSGLCQCTTSCDGKKYESGDRQPIFQSDISYCPSMTSHCR